MTSPCFPLKIHLDPAFLRPTIHSYYDKLTVSELETTLSFQIGRKPEDLVLHMQRIQYFIDLKLNGATFAALVDLFIVLKKRGKGFRSKMLESSRPVINSDQYSFLSDHFSTGLSQWSVIAGLKGSVLHAGLLGQVDGIWKNLP